MQYDPFQQQAIDFINQGDSVIVSAPTGSGKTAIAEHVIEQCLQRGEKVIYTAPIKALSNQKFRDFQVNYPDKIGILTGDITINPGAPTLIMTTEIFRNKILEEQSSLKGYSWIIYDEIHYLDDYERGTVWEESLIFLPDHMRLLGLSATIPNIEELAEWIESIHGRPIRVIKESKRPVPLHFFYQCQGEIYDDLNKLIRHGYHSPEFRLSRNRKFPRHVPVKANPPSGIIKFLNEEKLLPCIYFVFSRRRTEELAEEMQRFSFLDAAERTKIVALYGELCDRFDLTNEPSAFRLRPFVERGIAYHHAGMLPTLKEVVERLFTSRLIKVIFTTETFALGINMPAKSVIFDDLSKYYGVVGHAFLKTRDFYQMAGRAGRRSIDTEGYVFCRVNPRYVAPDQIQRMIFSEPEKVSSRFNASYATLLNLYAKYQERLYDIYPRSFHYFQEKKHSRQKAVDLLRAKVALLKDLGHIRKNMITEKGDFASKVYGYELILSELFSDGTLAELSEVQLGILAMAIVYEPRKGTQKPRLTPQAKSLERRIEDVAHTLARREHRFRIHPMSKVPAFHLAPAIEGWLKGEDFDKVLSYVSADEGEVVRYFRMGIQILREIIETPVPPDTKAKIHRLMTRINRDVIDAEKQLRS